jgi:crotonobetainyl-CoA:carnitine CoA-transferase CaiB-like acyl-CoA transferase
MQRVPTSDVRGVEGGAGFCFAHDRDQVAAREQPAQLAGGLVTSTAIRGGGRPASALDAGVPAAPILAYAEVLVSEQAKARNMGMEMEHPVEGTIRQLGFR